MRRWLLNSAVLPAGGYGIYRYTAATRAELAAYLAEPGWLSRVGYEETADVIESWTGIRPAISHEPSPLAAGDVAMVVRLRYRLDPSRKGARVRADDEAWEVARLERVDALDEQTAALRRLGNGAGPGAGSGEEWSVAELLREASNGAGQGPDGGTSRQGAGSLPAAPTSRPGRHVQGERDLRLLDEETIRLRRGDEPRTWEWIAQWIVLRERNRRWEAMRGLGASTAPLFRGSADSMPAALVLAHAAWRAWIDAEASARGLVAPIKPRVLVLDEVANAWEAVDSGRDEMSPATMMRLLRETPAPPPPDNNDQRRARDREARMAQCPWYVTAHAVRRWMQINRRPDSEAEFRAARDQLIRVAAGCWDRYERRGLAPTITRTGAYSYETGAGPRDRRITLIVSMERPEGPKPQLVDVVGGDRR